MGKPDVWWEDWGKFAVGAGSGRVAQLRFVNNENARSLVQIQFHFFPLARPECLDEFTRERDIRGDAQLRIRLKRLQQILDKFPVTVGRFNKDL